MKKNEKNLGTCVYCGKNRELTKDHVPPQNLFAKPRPSNLMTVPSCLECNGLASKDDEWFRLSLLLYEDTLLRPEPSKLLPKLMRSLERPTYPGLLKSFRSHLYKEEEYSSEGTYLGKVLRQRVDEKRLNRVAKRVVKGLYYLKLGERLPAESFVSAFSVSGKADILPTLQSVINKLKNQPVTLIGNGDVFTYRYRIHSRTPNISQWLLTFYETIKFVGFTIPNHRKSNLTLYPEPYIDF